MRFLVTLNRSAAIDPARIIRTHDLSPSGLSAGRRRGAEASRARSMACNRTFYLRRLLALRLPRGRRASAPNGRWKSSPRAMRWPGATSPRALARVSCKSALYSGWVRHRRFAPPRTPFRYRAVHDATWTWRSCRGCSTAAGSGRPGARPWRWFRRSDYLGDPRTCRWTRRCAIASRRIPASARAGRSACSRTCATSATASIP